MNYPMQLRELLLHFGVGGTAFERNAMKKSMAIIQIAVIAIIIVYGTISLYMGNFEGLYATFPLLFIYYIFVVARQKREKDRKDDNGSES